MMSIGLFDLIWKVFITIMNLTSEKSKKLNSFIDFILININCDLKLPLNTITYDDVIIRFTALIRLHIEEKHYFVNAYVSKSKIMLPA